MWKNKQDAFVLAEGLLAVTIVTSSVIWQSISIHQSLQNLETTKRELQVQRFKTIEEFQKWQEVKPLP